MNNHIIGLIIVLVIILGLNPHHFMRLYDSIMGRIIIIGTIVLLVSNNMTLGVLAALGFIIILDKYGKITEGLDDDSIKPPQTIGDDSSSVPNKNATKILTRDATNKDENIDKLKTKVADGETSGNVSAKMVDMAETLNAVDSNKFPVDKNTSSSVETEAYSSEMLNGGTEGFGNLASF